MGSASCSVFASVTGLPLGWGVFSASLQGKPFHRLLLQSSSLSLCPPVAVEMPRTPALCVGCAREVHAAPLLGARHRKVWSFAHSIRMPHQVLTCRLKGHCFNLCDTFLCGQKKEGGEKKNRQPNQQTLASGDIFSSLQRTINISL